MSDYIISVEIQPKDGDIMPTAISETIILSTEEYESFHEMFTSKDFCFLQQIQKFSLQLLNLKPKITEIDVPSPDISSLVAEKNAVPGKPSSIEIGPDGEVVLSEDDSSAIYNSSDISLNSSISDSGPDTESDSSPQSDKSSINLSDTNSEDNVIKENEDVLNYSKKFDDDNEKFQTNLINAETENENFETNLIKTNSENSDFRENVKVSVSKENYCENESKCHSDVSETNKPKLCSLAPNFSQGELQTDIRKLKRESTEFLKIIPDIINNDEPDFESLTTYEQTNFYKAGEGLSITRGGGRGVRGRKKRELENKARLIKSTINNLGQEVCEKMPNAEI